MLNLVGNNKKSVREQSSNYKKPNKFLDKTLLLDFGQNPRIKSKVRKSGFLFIYLKCLYCSIFLISNYLH